MLTKHQTQTKKDGCMSACMAMLVDKPVETVTQCFHNDYYIDQTVTPAMFLTMSGVKCHFELKEIESFAGELEKGLIYLLKVPSLNQRNVMHAVVVDTRPEEPVIYDPLMGFEDKLYYKQFGTGELDLRYWTIDLVILPPLENTVPCAKCEKEIDMSIFNGNELDEYVCLECQNPDGGSTSMKGANNENKN